MAKIKSSATSDLLTIDPTSKAARVSLYNSGGTNLMAQPTGVYIQGFHLGAGGAHNFDTIFWAMNNPTGNNKTFYIKSIHINISCQGTGFPVSDAITGNNYTVWAVRVARDAQYNASNAGTSQVTPIGKMRTSYPSSSATIFFNSFSSSLDLAKTTGGSFQERIVASFVNPQWQVTGNQYSVALNFRSRYNMQRSRELVISPGDSMSLGTFHNATWLGTMSGCVVWEEI